MLLSLSLLSLIATSLANPERPWENHTPHVLKKRDSLPQIPSGNQVYVGLWLNGQQGYSDTPAAANARTNMSWPMFQFGQRIPLAPYNYVAGTGWPAFTYLIDWTNTNAAYFLSIYADSGIAAVTDGDLVALGAQLAGYEAAGRTIYLRFLPEMQGAWNVYGLQPTAYIALWKRMYAIIKEMAPTTMVIWSPNLSVGYPYGTTLSQIASPADQRLLDTNHDGQLTNEDDAFAPYFPGAQYIDAAGISLYYKGPDYSDLNQPQPGGLCANILNGIDSFSGQQTTPFYSNYCTLNKPCAISEFGAAYHVNVRGGDSQLQMEEAFWNDCITNATFLDTFPEIKLMNIFEQEKLETDGNGPDLRDYRVTNVSTIANAFVEAMSAMGTRFAFATPTVTVATGTAIPTTNPVLVGTALMTQTLTAIPEVVTWTQTTYSSPTQTGITPAVVQAANPSSQGILAAVPSQSSSSGSLAIFTTASLLSAFVGALFIL